MVMNKALDYILAVSREHSFSKAAEKLYISQPSLSTAIQKEEHKWGTSFFDRSSTPVELTEDGSYYIQTMKEILELQNQMKVHFSENKKKKNLIINMGGPSYFCTYVLPSLIQSFCAVHPSCKINLFEVSDSDLLQYLQSDVIDFCLTVQNIGIPYQSIPVGSEDIVLAVPSFFEINRILTKYKIPASAFADGSYKKENYMPVPMEYFKSEPFLLLKKGNDLYSRAMKICREGHFTPRVVMELDQLLTSYHIAASGKGVTFIRADLIRCAEPTSHLRFYKIDSPRTARSIHLVYKKNKILSELQINFIDFLESRVPCPVNASGQRP
jgi:DNA-binding transcriptional LysR family regulator